VRAAASTAVILRNLCNMTRLPRLFIWGRTPHLDWLSMTVIPNKARIGKMEAADTFESAISRNMVNPGSVAPRRGRKVVCHGRCHGFASGTCPAQRTRDRVRCARAQVRRILARLRRKRGVVQSRSVVCISSDRARHERNWPACQVKVLAVQKRSERDFVNPSDLGPLRSRKRTSPPQLRTSATGPISLQSSSDTCQTP
jgi:hypothetical protein